MSEKKRIIAVYGTLRLGQGNYRYLLDNEESKHLGTTVVDDHLTLIDYAHGGFPALVQHESGNTPVVVDVFEVSEAIGKRVDSLEGYRESDTYHHFYDRKEIDTEFGKALIYVMGEDILDLPKIESGDWVKYKQELRSKYQQI